MPGGLDFWHAECWEFARLQRAPVIAAARRRAGAVNDLSAYLIALRRDPDLPRLSLDGLAPVGSAILDRPEPCRVAADNDRYRAHKLRITGGRPRITHVRHTYG